MNRKFTLIELMITLTVISIIAIICIKSGGCSQVSAKRYGGTMTVCLPANQKMVNVTWKENTLWILTRTARPGDVQDTYSFKEKSTLGILEGEVKFVERLDVPKPEKE